MMCGRVPRCDTAASKGKLADELDGRPGAGVILYACSDSVWAAEVEGILEELFCRHPPGWSRSTSRCGDFPGSGPQPMSWHCRVTRGC